MLPPLSWLISRSECHWAVGSAPVERNAVRCRSRPLQQTLSQPDNWRLEKTGPEAPTSKTLLVDQVLNRDFVSQLLDVLVERSFALFTFDLFFNFNLRIQE